MIGPPIIQNLLQSFSTCYVYDWLWLLSCQSIASTPEHHCQFHCKCLYQKLPPFAIHFHMNLNSFSALFVCQHKPYVDPFPWTIHQPHCCQFAVHSPLNLIINLISVLFSSTSVVLCFYRCLTPMIVSLQRIYPLYSIFIPSFIGNPPFTNYLLLHILKLLQLCYFKLNCDIPDLLLCSF